MTEYTAAERKVLVDQQFAALEAGTTAPEFAMKGMALQAPDEVTKTFNEYHTRFIAGELTKEELERYDDDWLTALKEKDRKAHLDFIDDEGRQLIRNEKACVNARPKPIWVILKDLLTSSVMRYDMFIISRAGWYGTTVRVVGNRTPTVPLIVSPKMLPAGSLLKHPEPVLMKLKNYHRGRSSVSAVLTLMV
jgi:hypothetical protein